MNNKNKKYSLSTRAAAALLASQANEGSVDEWVTRLRNWRKNDRLSPLSWDATSPRPKYDAAELAEFAKVRKQEAAALALTNTTPTDELPSARAVSVRTEDGHPVVAIDWRDTSVSGHLVLTITSAQSFARSLESAIAASTRELDRQFDQQAERDVAVVKACMTVSSVEPSPSGELPVLVELRKPVKATPATSSATTVTLEIIALTSSKELSKARVLESVAIGPVTYTQLRVQDKSELHTFTRDGHPGGWLIRGAIDLHQLCSDQIGETLAEGRNHTQLTTSGITAYSFDWEGSPEPVHLFHCGDDSGAFMVYPAGLFDDCDPHDTAI